MEQRLIDADALLKKFERMWDCTDIVFEPKELLCDPLSDYKGCKWKEILDFVKRIVKSSKTVDAVPVIHAHPIFEYGRDNAKCSNCGNYTIEFNPYAFEYDKYDISNWDKYCSFCGAKMDEEDDENEHL